MLVDTHAHIHDREFGADAHAAIARAQDAGVTFILTLGVNRADSQAAVDLAERHDNLLVAAGVHPHDAQDATDADLDALQEMACDPLVAVVGEIGLDYYRDLSPRDVQRRVFERQLATASRAGKPVAVHARDAHDDVLPMLEAWSRAMGGRLPDGRRLGVMHYFSGDADLARRYIELGFLISVHTSVTHPKAALLQSVARDVALEHLVVETDSPYGAPQRYRGKRNEPAYVVEAARRIAELKGVSFEAVASATTANAIAFLGVHEAPPPPAAAP